MDLLLIDEAARVDDTLYKSVRPMLLRSGGSMILMSTPFGKRGFFFEEWENGGNEWKRIMFRASQNDRLDKSFLDAERKSLGDLWYGQEYECQFLDTINQIFGYDLVAGAFTNEIDPLFPAEVEPNGVELLFEDTACTM